MAPRHRPVIWSERARDTLDEAIGYIAQTSVDRARQVLTRILDAAESLERLSERGRVMPEAENPDIRELMVDPYRLIYHVYPEKVGIVALVHGARDFGTWVREFPLSE